ncbi:MAG TPA: CvpA family protein [Verrucomicrobiae bacterium]|nr:CvpA family protein [Verrucomicrobiae bacterium]
MANPPFNLFDILLAVVLVGGIIHGRKHGISLELLSMSRWLALVLFCAVAYRPAGTLIAGTGIFDLLTCYLFSYLGAALAILLIFSILERRVAPKLVGSDIFGRSEYFLGMGSGLVRFACILLAGLALLNAREFTTGELRDLQRYQEENYGSNIFPGLHSLQVAVFENSLTGGFIKHNLGFLLISPTSADQKGPTIEARAR